MAGKMMNRRKEILDSIRSRRLVAIARGIPAEDIVDAVSYTHLDVYKRQRGGIKKFQLIQKSF